MDEAALQDRYAPKGICFGCGPSNAKGIRIKSHVRGDEVVLCWRPEKFYEAYEGLLSGGASARSWIATRSGPPHTTS